MKAQTNRSAGPAPCPKRVFLDIDSLTQWDHHVTQRFPQAEKVPLTGLEPGSTGPWDAAATTSFGSVLKEDGLFRMWYYGQRVPRSVTEQTDLPTVCYAESEDGIHWRKPDLKLTGQRLYPGNNILAIPGAPCGVVPALPGTDTKYLACTITYAIPLEEDIQDVPGIPDPLGGGNGTQIWASDDGLRWRHVTRILAHGDNACFYADRATNRYRLHNKVGGMHGMTTRRMWIGLESRDGKHWEGYEGPRRWRETFVCDDYVPITGDLIRAPVRFRNASLERIPRELPLTVRFELTRAEVFAYEWANEGGGPPRDGV